MNLKWDGKVNVKRTKRSRFVAVSFTTTATILLGIATVAGFGTGASASVARTESNRGMANMRLTPTRAFVEARRQAERGGADEIPDKYRPRDLIPADMELRSSRLLGVVNDANYWLIGSSDGRKCLVAAFGGDDWYAASTCAEEQIVRDLGLGLRIVAEERASEAYYVSPEPVGLQDSPLIAKVSSELYSVDPNLAAAERQSLRDDLGIAIIVDAPLSPAGRR